MDTIARSYLFISVIQVLLYQVSAQQQPVTQYVVSNYAPSNGPSGVPQNAPRPLTTLSNIASVPAVAPIKPVAKPPEVTTGPLDSNVLNNLAIALQLLIVSNIMNMPATEPVPIPNIAKLESLLSKYESLPYSVPISYIEQPLSKPKFYEGQIKSNVYPLEALSKPFYSYEAQPVPKPSLYSYETQQLQSIPNANFLGSSGMADPVFGMVGKARPNPRSSVTLMSPYDALGTSSFGDPLSSGFSSYSKNDFQSPYASMLAADGARDMFSIADLF